MTDRSALSGNDRSAVAGNDRSALAGTDRFADRHIGPSQAEVDAMLAVTGHASLDALVEATVPRAIRLQRRLDLPAARTEQEMLARARELAAANTVRRSFIGMGYHRTHTPPVILRNVMENPGWYTQYTPYQAEIAQGRLEALLNFQTVVTELTGLELANASLLDEGTAAAEAMTLALDVSGGKRSAFVVASDCHPQTIAVVQTRAEPLGIEVRVQAPDALTLDADVFGVLVQYPATDGRVVDLAPLCSTAHDAGALVVVATDLLALTLLRPPGELGADIAVGSAQRFGVPLGYGGPHAAFFATREAHKRRLPGRLVGVSRDTEGHPALRLALQTREQHIRRDRATSNICTSQVLLAVMASMYAVYHGPEGLRRIARRVKRCCEALAAGAAQAGLRVQPGPRFDTVRFQIAGAQRDAVLARAEAAGVEVRVLGADALTVSVDEATTAEDLRDLLAVLAGDAAAGVDLEALAAAASDVFEGAFARQSEFLTHEVFHRYHSEHELLRYLHRLQARDLSLTTSMIPLGSCTMKLNATAEMIPVTLPGFGDVHPFSPRAHARGYQTLIAELEAALAEITGLPGVSLQPNAGSQGEYAGLLAIRGYLAGRGEGHRDVCLIPSSAHGTNPASAVMAGMRVVVVACDALGNIDLADLRDKAARHAGELACIMVTYPSTHGVFEEGIVELCEVVHGHGGQVYMDGANMNAQVGLCRPGDFGVDVCHLNLHKTFCIPHGGGGPGVGPIAAAPHLQPYLPGHSVIPIPGADTVGPVSAAPWGSASILPISWMYIAMMGPAGLERASQVAILNANYLAARLRGPYDILYTGAQGTVAHELIVDVRPLQKAAGITVADVAKRLMDYGFHAPTMSWPVAGTLMIEPTESETKAELDRFADAMLSIRAEIQEIIDGQADRQDNLLRNAPHTARAVTADAWSHPYSRERAAFPAPWLREHKFWPAVSRIDDAFGDRNLVCTCLPLDAYA
ncbi:MAG: aminomethyl-transferring glycine dehydrogenase [Deltaproteobacteria bacterium]|nr:aminomethyl-transferring glycine dehydrogenase [Deltaproteobacteria bacterium]